MNSVNLKQNVHNKPQKKNNKVKITSTIPPEDRLNTMVDIIIERMLEERNKNVDV